MMDETDLPRWQAQRANAVSPEECQRLARAYEAKARSAPAPPPPPTRRATSSEECGCCGIPGVKGCAHQLPFVRPEAGKASKRTDPRMSTAWANGERGGNR